MAISFACPHCGKQTSVAEQYAGQTGPCAACGQQITIPGVPAAAQYAYKPAPSSGMGAGMVILLVLAVGALCVIPVLIALLLPAVQAAREAARRMQSTNNMKMIGIAMHNYHDVYGEFPPAVVSDANGQPLYSGRVLLLPFIEQQLLFDRFDKTQAWDSPANMPLSQQMLPVFTDPSSRRRMQGQTDYLFVSGQGTLYDPARKGSRGIQNIVDGTSNTLMLVEVKDSGIHWSEPRDLDISQPMPLPQGNHPRGNVVGLFDGAVRFVSDSVDPGIVRSMATPDGGESASLDY